MAFGQKDGILIVIAILQKWAIFVPWEEAGNDAGKMVRLSDVSRVLGVEVGRVHKDWSKANVAGHCS